MEHYRTGIDQALTRQCPGDEQVMSPFPKKNISYESNDQIAVGEGSGSEPVDVPKMAQRAAHERATGTLPPLTETVETARQTGKNHL